MAIPVLGGAAESVTRLHSPGKLSQERRMDQTSGCETDRLLWLDPASTMEPARDVTATGSDGCHDATYSRGVCFFYFLSRGVAESSLGALHTESAVGVAHTLSGGMSNCLHSPGEPRLFTCLILCSLCQFQVFTPTQTLSQ